VTHEACVVQAFRDIEMTFGTVDVLEYSPVNSGENILHGCRCHGCHFKGGKAGWLGRECDFEAVRAQNGGR